VRKMTLILLIMGLVFSMSATAAGTEDPQQTQGTGSSGMTSGGLDANIPAEWYEPIKLASEVGIRSFGESPLLADRVTSGELPPVQERLPDDPPVIYTYDGQEGKYGGQMLIWGKNLNNGDDTWILIGDNPHAGIVTPNGQDIFPFMVKGWEYNDDYTQITLNLHEGMKWSDGHPFTADDYLGTYEYYFNEKALTPIPPAERRPVAMTNMEKVDDFTVRLTYASPVPREIDIDYTRSMGGWMRWNEGIRPFHFLQQYHPAFVDEAELTQKAKGVGLERWDEYTMRMMNNSKFNIWEDGQAPDLRPYIWIERTETYAILERNPYYPFVDQFGNQLPYIDTIKVNLASNNQAVVNQTVTGNGDFSGRRTSITDLALYKSNEANGDYRTLLWPKSVSPDLALIYNLNHKDAGLREIFSDIRFRQATSLAIDRDDMNNKAYLGLGTPLSTSVPPTSAYYEEKYGNNFIEHDLDEANRLLDEMGMKDTNGDGLREAPNGQKFNPTIRFSTSGSIDPTAVMEIVKQDWMDVGIDVDLKFEEISLWRSNIGSNDWDISTWSLSPMDLSMGSNNLIHFAITNVTDTPSPWPLHALWYKTHGEQGLEPEDPVVLSTIELAERVDSPVDGDDMAAAIAELLEINYENLWTVGLIGMVKQPILVSNRLHNVAEAMIWDGSLQYPKATYPAQFWLEE